MYLFLKSVKSRLNLGIAIKAFLMVVSVISILLIMVSLVYVFRGLAVSGYLYGLASFLVLISTGSLWLIKKKSNSEVAVYIDRFFGLKDSVNTAIHFENMQGESAVKELQYDYTLKQIEGLEAKEIPIPVSRKLITWAVISSVVAFSLSFIPPSQAVIDQLAKEEATKKRTTELKTQLEGEIEDLLANLTDAEKYLINEDEVRKWIKGIKPTAREREAMLNIARAKQNIQKQLTKLENRKNDALLKTASLKLNKAKNLKVKATGEAMAMRDFDEINRSLEAFKARQEKFKEMEEKKDELNALRDKLKKGEELTKEEREKLMKEIGEKLAQMRELTKLLAEAAQENQFGENGGEAGDYDEMGEMGEFPGDLPLDELMEMLDRYAQQMQGEYEGDLLEVEEMSLEDLRELLESLEEMDEGLGELQEEMDEMGARRRLAERLKGLRDTLEGRHQGRSRLLGLAGKKPGVGTDSRRRDERDPDIDNDKYTKLKGKQGKGPVMKKTEAADSGFGESRRKGSKEERSFEHQMSTFMSRDDVPEDMKQAMRQYFKDIHAVEEAK